ncbi:MBL fold metallo-hydrolase [Thermaurantiacus tibetensis]|uniref:MBL fold metallo-hydrolase n=1 Tax=Thermaurantiacus tibetensis TaxID=2759035 RepID=UPI001A9C4F76|nr:MBL fold metallo-hydrolase [Thermaurantiacus tibetensis]
MSPASPLPRVPLERRGLVYPYGMARPADGALAEVAEGVWWLRMPLPFSLDHINLWLLDGGDHWVVVDTGVNSPAVADHWRALLAGPLAGRPVGRILVTHYHPDHIGLAGWLSRKCQAPLLMTRGEFMLARVLTLDVAPEVPADVLAFYAAAGWSEEQIRRMEAAGWGRFARGVSRLPTGYQRLRDGDRLDIGGRSWTVVVGSGHSPEHACLHCPEAGLLISGDQVLPRITSNVSVYPTEPEADPLGDWLDSLARLRELPEETLVLPAHNEPFLGLHRRIDQLERDHHDKLDRLAAMLAEPRTVTACFPALFGRAIATDELQMATGEALAHLAWLVRRGRAEVEAEGSVRRYRARDARVPVSRPTAAS